MNSTVHISFRYAERELRSRLHSGASRPLLFSVLFLLMLVAAFAVTPPLAFQARPEVA